MRYEVTDYIEERGEQSLVWGATLRRDGRRVATVRNAGDGRATRYWWKSAEEREAFGHAAATATGVPDGADIYLRRLVQYAWLDGLSGAAVELDGEDFFVTGRVRVLPDAPQSAARVLTGPGWAVRRPRVWSSARRRFVHAGQW